MFAAMLLAASCSLPPAFAVDGDYARLGPQMEALLDEQRVLTLDQVTSAPACDQFSALHDSPDFGPRSGGVWLRFRAGIPGNRPDRWRIAVRFAGLERVCLHWPLRGNQTRSECRGRTEDGWHGDRVVFELPLDFDDRRPAYLYAETGLWLKVPTELATADALLEREASDKFQWGIYYGLLIAIMLVSLVSFFGGGDRAFLYFALHLAALTGGLAIWQGQIARYDVGPYPLTQLAGVLISLFFALGAAFYQRFLDTRTHLPGVARVFRVLIGVALALALLAGLAPQISTRLLGVYAMVWLATVLWASLARVRQGDRPAIAVLSAVGVLLFAIFANSIEIFGLHILSAAAALQLAFIGALVASAFLVAGLMFRVRGLTDERNRAAELAQASQQLALRRARFDELTGLPNRGKFREDGQERLIQATQGGKRIALVTIGLDKFRAINHAIGHEGGDAVLVEIALRLRHAMQAEDLLARIGADTFGWLTTMPGGQIAELKARCAVLRKTLAAPLLSGRGAVLSSTMGVSIFPTHASTVEPLLRASEEAFYSAKDLGGGGIEVFDPELRRSAQRYMQLSKDLRQALIRDELDLHYQPLVAMDARGEMVGVEALLRWNRQGVMIPPDQFIPIAESTELIVPLTDWVFRRACRQLVEWQRRQVPVPGVSVNISPYQFRLPGFAERIEGVLKEFGLGGECITLEITESALLDDLASARETLQRLRNRGVRVAVDDFGVGYSSLSYLRTLPVDSVKIDRSFLQGVPAESEAVSVVNAIISLGRDLGLKVTAEGIETQEQHHYLAQRGTDVGQGYLIARPMPAEQLEVWLLQKQPQSFAA